MGIKGILLLNGPNLNLLGRRDPEIYGKETLEDVIKLMDEEAKSLSDKKLAISIEPRQSNREGDLITWIQEAPKDGFIGIVLNAGGLTHTSVVLRDAIAFASSQEVPTVEVHLSNIHAREPFRHISLLAGVCIDQISGLGVNSYISGLNALMKYIRRTEQR